MLECEVSESVVSPAEQSAGVQIWLVRLRSGRELAVEVSTDLLLGDILQKHIRGFCQNNQDSENSLLLVIIINDNYI